MDRPRRMAQCQRRHRCSGGLVHAPPRDDPRGCLHRGVGAKGGVDGGLTITGIDMSLKTQDPERYSRLSHPGDAIRYVQPGRPAGAGVARRGAGSADAAIRCGYRGVTVGDVLDDLRQLRGSAREGFDGFLAHSRFGGAAPLDGINTLEAFEQGRFDPSPFRDDLRVPTMNVITETDVVGAVLPGYGEAGGQRPAADVGDRRHRARGRLHRQGRLHRHRF